MVEGDTYPGHKGDEVAYLKRVCGVEADDPTTDIAGMLGPGAQYPTVAVPDFARMWQCHPTPTS